MERALVREWVFESMAEPVLVLDARGLLVDLNPAAERLLKVARAAVLGTRPQDALAHLPQLGARLAGEGLFAVELELGEGPTHGFYEVRATVLQDGEGAPAGRLCVFRPITQRKLLESELIQMAYHDPLTGLYNRRKVQERLDHALSLAARYTWRVALLYLDLNHFKQVNDSLGHDAGDELLVEVARRLSGCVRESDTLGRIGGDEFALVLNNVSIDEATSVADRICRALAEPCQLRGKALRVGVSVGIALLFRDGVERSELMKHADDAMYRAKQKGGGYEISAVA